MQSPLLGFNNNVRHRGRLFHIQTEDSGVRHPHVITHLYMDGGRILKTVKTSYAVHLGSDSLAEVVRELMKEQHKMMFIALRDGQFDDALDLNHPPVASSAGVSSPSRDGLLPMTASLAGTEAAGPPSELAASASQAAGSEVSPEPGTSSFSSTVSKKDGRDKHSPGRYVISRPAAL